MQSNPIQQRIELIGEKWEEAKANKDARIIRIKCQADEEEMVDTFYTYMIGTDTPVLDIAFHFDSACNNLNLFSTSLLKELEEVIYIWNNSRKSGNIDYVPVNWAPDYTLQKDKNPATLFVSNFNSLAKKLDLEDGLFTVAIFKRAIYDKDFIVWLQHAIKANISPAVKFLIHDTIAKPFFQKLSIELPLTISTIPLNLNMSKAMEQIASMGDPKDPATGYRREFMKMMNAMSANDENEAEKCGQKCIDIATQNLSKDPYWILQVVVVYNALGNDKIKHKKKPEALAFAHKAVETAIASKTYFDNEVPDVLMAQTLMFRGTVFFIQGDNGNAFSDFNIAFDAYKKQGNMPLAIEACRMAGKTALKNGQKINGIKVLTEGIRFGKNMDQDMVRASTYAGLFELLLQTNYNSFISTEELHGIARHAYGENWSSVINTWQKAPDVSAIKQKEIEAVQD
ncbi:MAG TPA: hypothetical protein VFW07_04925 [Parafilimonas sp.]|nr:hypothetical protein [Parafilimonas sp.]